MTRPSKNLFDVAEESVRGGLALFMGDALSTAILAIGSILIARLLGPEGYGLYSLSLAVPTIMLSLTAFGIDQAMIRFPARLKAEGRLGHIQNILKSAIAFRFVTGLVMWLICLLLSDILATYLLNRPEIGFYIRVSSFLIIAQSLFTLLYNTFIGLGVSGRGAALKVLMSIVKSTLAPALIIIGLGITGAVTAHVLSYVSACLIGATILYNQYRKLRAAKEMNEASNNGFRSNLRLMTTYGLPLYASSLLMIFMDQYRILLLAHNVTDLEIGSFQAAGNFISLLAVISTPIALAIFPAFSKLEPGSDDIKKAFHYSVKYTAMILTPASVFTIIMSKHLIEVVYGHEYQMAIQFLSFYAAMYLYSILGLVVLANLFSGIGETRINLTATLLYALTFIPSSTILTHLYHVPGLIISILISLLLNLAYYIHVAAKKYDMRINYQNSFKILAAAWAAALTLIPLIQNTPLPNYISLIIGTVAYITAYLTALPMLKALTKTDLENLNTLLGKYKHIKPIINLITKYESKLLHIKSSS